MILEENLSVFHYLSMISPVRFSYMVFIMLEVLSFYSWLLHVLITEVLNFVKSFFFINQDYGIFPFILLIWYYTDQIFVCWAITLFQQ